MVSVLLVTSLGQHLLTETTPQLRILASTKVPLELSLMVSVLLVTFLDQPLLIAIMRQLKILVSSPRPADLMDTALDHDGHDDQQEDQ